MVVLPLDVSLLEVMDEDRQNIRLGLFLREWPPWVLSMMNYSQIITEKGNSSGFM